MPPSTTSPPPRLTEHTDSHWRPRPTSASSSGRATERAVVILDDIMLRAGAEGGRAFTVARAAVCLLFLVREIAVDHAGLLRGEPENILDVVVFSVAMLVSLFFYWAIPRVVPTPRGTWITRLVGCFLDALLFFLVMLGMQLWPASDYTGLLNRPYVHFIGLVVVGSALRFDVSFVLLSALFNAVSLGVLVWIDFHWRSDRVTYGLNYVVFDVAVLLSGAIIGIVYCNRARNLALRGARRAIDAARVREKLGAYLGKEVAAEALAQDEVELGGKRQPVAVMFSDLRNFTSTAESLDPEELVAQLNAYLEDMVRVIVDAGGVVDKYLGDGIMAVFGAPHGRPDDAWRALDAVRRLQGALELHNRARAGRGLPPLSQGIGLHYGAAVAGNIGTREHAQYTIVGDVVNVASRLESMTKEHGASVLISRDLVDAARATRPFDDVVAFGTLPIRGRQQPLEVFVLKPPAETNAPLG